MKTCREVVTLVASNSIQKERLWSRIGVRLHLRFCVHCSRLVRQLKQITGLSHTMCEEPPADLEQKIMDRLMQEHRPHEQ